MRGRSRRKAISPIIATLILIVMTVVAGIMLYGFVSGFMANLGTSRAIAPISIASASVSSSGLSSGGQGATIVVSNLGTTPVTITQVNLLNASTGALLVTFTNIGTSYPPTSTSVTVAGGTTTTIYADPPDGGGHGHGRGHGGGGSGPGGGIPRPGTTVLVQVVTSTGSYAETSVVVGP